MTFKLDLSLIETKLKFHLKSIFFSTDSKKMIINHTILATNPHKFLLASF